MISFIDEDQLSAVLQQFYNETEAVRVAEELAQRTMSLALLKGSVASMKKGVFLRSTDSEWIVSVKDKSSFSFTKDGFLLSDNDGGRASATLLRDGSPHQSLNKKAKVQSDDLLLVVHGGNILVFDFEAERVFYRSIND